MLQQPATELHQQVQNALAGVPAKRALIQFLRACPAVSSSLVKSPAVGPAISHDTLSQLYKTLSTPQELWLRVPPSTDMGAVGLAAVNYHLDISSARDPLYEYSLLHQMQTYVPGDSDMQFWYLQNPAIYDLSLSFHPLFPAEYYSDTMLRNLVRSEGYLQTEIPGTAISLLHTAHVTDTFHLGRWPQMVSDCTAIYLTPVSEVPVGELFGYGQKAERMVAVSMEELLHYFRNSKNFLSPFDNQSRLSPIALHKLKLLLRSGLGPTQKLVADSTQSLARELLETLSLIEGTQSQDKALSTFVLSYMESEDARKKLVQDTLRELLHVGMYMRGWLGPKHEYPVIRTSVSADRQGEVDLKVSQTLQTYEEMIQQLGSVGSQVTALALVSYCDGLYVPTTTSEMGLTIGERIAIVRQGENTENMSSCIRLSSNYLCASAHKYMIALGLPAPFDIFHLRAIS